MNKIYYVMIKGRTLESRNLRELLARAVSAKRKLECKSCLQTHYYDCGWVPAIRDNPHKAAADFC